MKRILGLTLLLAIGCSSPDKKSGDPKSEIANSASAKPTYWRLYSVSADRNPKTDQFGKFSFAIDHASHFEASQTEFLTKEQDFLTFLHRLDPVSVVQHVHGPEVEWQAAKEKQPSNLKILSCTEDLLVVELKGFFKPLVRCGNDSNYSDGIGLGDERSYQLIYLRKKFLREEK